MNDNKHKLFHEPECISEEMMIRYIKDELSSKEKHKVEKHVLDCSLCADALEGLMLVEDKSRIRPIIQNINQKVLRIKPQTRVIWMDTRVRVAIAAGFALLIVSVFYFKNELSDKGPGSTVSENAATKEDEKSAEITHTDSVSFMGPEKPEMKDLVVANNMQEESKSLVPKSTGESNDVPKDERNQNEGLISVQDKTDETAVGSEKLKEKEEDNKPTQDISKPNTVVSGNVTSSGTTNDVSPSSAPPQTYQWNTNTDVKTVKKEKEDSGKKNKSKTDSAPKKEQQEDEKLKQPLPSAQNVYYSVETKDGQNNLDDLEKLSDKDSSKSTVTVGDTLSVVNYNSQAKKKFDVKDYSGAAALYEQTLVSSPNNSEALLYSAQCYIELNKTDIAVKKLDKLIASGGKDNVEAGKYYKALALLKKNDKEGAKKLLNDVIAADGKYKEKAQKQLETTK